MRLTNFGGIPCSPSSAEFGVRRKLLSSGGHAWRHSGQGSKRCRDSAGVLLRTREFAPHSIELFLPRALPSRSLLPGRHKAVRVMADGPWIVRDPMSREWRGSITGFVLKNCIVLDLLFLGGCTCRGGGGGWPLLRWPARKPSDGAPPRFVESEFSVFEVVFLSWVLQGAVAVSCKANQNL